PWWLRKPAAVAWKAVVGIEQASAPVAIAEETVVPDALEGLGQHVEQEPADELVGGNRHRPLPISVAIILPAETDLRIFDADQTIIGDGDAVSVPGDVGQYLLGSGESGFGVDHPCDRRSPGKENGNVT